MATDTNVGQCKLESRDSGTERENEDRGQGETGGEAGNRERG